MNKKDEMQRVAKAFYDAYEQHYSINSDLPLTTGIVSKTSSEDKESGGIS